MKHIIFTTILCGSLVACDQFKQMTGQTVAGVAGGVTVASVTPENLQKIGALCNAGGAALNVAAKATNAAVLQETAVYGAAYCRPILDGLPPPPTTDKNTATWLQTIIDALPSLARTAQIVLPTIMGR
jgi:hypothetical protein